MGKKNPKDLLKEHFVYINQHEVNSVKNGKTLDDRFIYIQPEYLISENKIDRYRELYRIVNVNTGNYIIRQVRAISSSGFIKNENDDQKELFPITMSYQNEVELGLNDKHTVKIKPKERYDLWRFYANHPKQDIRLAFWGILTGISFGVLSTVLSIIGLLK